MSPVAAPLKEIIAPVGGSCIRQQKIIQPTHWLRLCNLCSPSPVSYFVSIGITPMYHFDLFHAKEKLKTSLAKCSAAVKVAAKIKLSAMDHQEPRGESRCVKVACNLDIQFNSTRCLCLTKCVCGILPEVLNS